MVKEQDLSHSHTDISHLISPTTTKSSHIRKKITTHYFDNIQFIFFIQKELDDWWYALSILDAILRDAPKWINDEN